MSEGTMSTIKKRRCFLDLSRLTDISSGKKCQWIWQILAEQLSQFKFTNFHETKIGVVEPTIKKICQLQQWGQ
jgi:hypothetical protein